jgi:Fe-S cluster biogenesis protein NfuA
LNFFILFLLLYLEKSPGWNPDARNPLIGWNMENLIDRVESALNSVRPYLQTDGGNVKVIEITDDYTVKLELMGACGSCPMSSMTFKAGLEEAILKAVPEIRKVEALNLTPAF